MILRGLGTRRQRDFDEQRALSHYLAGLVAYAFHQPDKMPEFKTDAPAKRDDAAADVDHERVRGILIGMAMRGG